MYWRYTASEGEPELVEDFTADFTAFIATACSAAAAAGATSARARL